MTTREERLMKAREHFDTIITLEVLEEAEQMHKRLSRISHEELHRKFST
jgi:hypothetical protein